MPGQLYHYTLGSGARARRVPTPTPTATPTATATATGTPRRRRHYPCSGHRLQRELRWRGRSGPAYRLGRVKYQRYNLLGYLDFGNARPASDTAKCRLYRRPGDRSASGSTPRSLTVSSTLAQVSFRNNYNLEASGGNFLMAVSWKFPRPTSMREPSLISPMQRWAAVLPAVATMARSPLEARLRDEWRGVAIRGATSPPWRTSDRTSTDKQSSCVFAWSQTTATVRLWAGGVLTLITSVGVCVPFHIDSDSNSNTNTDHQHKLPPQLTDA